MAPVDVRKRLEQIRKNKNKKVNSNSNVKDLRTIIVRKTRNKGERDRSPDRVVRGRVTKYSRSSSSGNSMDLRDTNRKLASRRASSQSRDRSDVPARSDRLSSRYVQPSRAAPAVGRQPVTSGQPVRIGKRIVHQQQYYVPPHMQRSQPNYMMAPNATPKSTPETQTGASVLISNLAPSVNQSDIIELFGNIGIMTAVNMINQTTALVTYQNSKDAVTSVKIYNNRSLDDVPMVVNMMPNSM